MKALFHRLGVAPSKKGEAFSIIATRNGVSLIREKDTLGPVFIEPDQLQAIIESLIEAKVRIEFAAQHENQERLFA